MQKFFSWGNWVSIRREFLTTQNMAGCEGVRVRIKVIEPSFSALFRFTLADVVSFEDYEEYGTNDELWWSDHENVLTAESDWVAIEIPFDDFYLSNGDNLRYNNREFDRDKIIAFELTIVTSVADEGHFLINNIEVY
jgi:hypothetical protein